MFKVGFSTLGCPGYTIEQVAAAAKEHQYDGVELRFIRGEVDLASLEEFSPARIAETRKVFDDAGIEVNCIDTSVRFAGGADIAAQRELAKTNCEIAAALGARYIRVFGGTIGADTPFGAGVDEVAEGIGLVAEDSAAAGVTTLLETHDSFCTSEAVGALLDRTSDELQVLWDFLHTFRHGESAEQTWAALGQRIRQVHVKDAYTATPDGFQLALTGDGIVPIGSLLTVLRDAGFDGYLDYEWEKAWRPEIAEPEIALPHFRSALRQMLA